jgi:hypothetical protein
VLHNCSGAFLCCTSSSMPVLHKQQHASAAQQNHVPGLHVLHKRQNASVHKVIEGKSGLLLHGP